MCGRYAIPDPGDIPVRFKATRSGYDFKPRYNAAPSENLPVVINDGENHVELMRWGLVPFWAKDTSIGYKMINARAETLQVKPSFKKALSLQRCIIPAGGFFEWKQIDKEKVPYYIFLKNKELFGIAGLYDVWHDKEGKELKTYTIITTEPNALVGEIHNRMPVILEKKDEEEWLNPDETETEKLVKLLHPYPASEMYAYAVSRLVNAPKNDTKEVIEPVNS
jgi:putative SOS response-associated peptidase YedK